MHAEPLFEEDGLEHGRRVVCRIPDCRVDKDGLPGCGSLLAISPSLWVSRRAPRSRPVIALDVVAPARPSAGWSVSLACVVIFANFGSGAGRRLFMTAFAKVFASCRARMDLSICAPMRSCRGRWSFYGTHMLSGVDRRRAERKYDTYVYMYALT